MYVNVAQGVDFIKFHLQGQLSRFTQLKADEFRDVVADKLDIPRHLIAINGIAEGSIIITLQVPKRWNGTVVVGFLLQQIQKKEEWLESNNILDIEVHGKPYHITDTKSELFTDKESTVREIFSLISWR